MQHSVELIKYNSSEYYQACHLRYKLFFAEHNLPWNIVLNQSHSSYFHAAVVIQDRVVAYGQLVPHRDRIYQICQMVVQPSYQKQNLGKKILSTLIQIAKERGAIAITLNARLIAIGFYQKLGFQAYGTEFPSTTTGVPHVKMYKEL